MTASFWVWVFSDRSGLDWVLENYLMAFAESKSSTVLGSLSRGDQAVLYAAGRMGRGGMALCGSAQVVGKPYRGDGPAIQGGRFRILVPIEVTFRLDEEDWVPIRPLVSRLQFLPDGASWGWPLQRSPLKVTSSDFEVMVSALRQAQR